VITEMGKYVKVLKERPVITLKTEKSLAEKIVQEYLDTKEPFGAIAHASLKKEYKNIASLARILGRTLARMKITNVQVSSDAENVYLTQKEPEKAE